MNELIGKTIDETMDENWHGLWPIIDKDGIIQDVVDSDYIPDDAIFVDWRNGIPVETPAEYGFDAILRRTA